MCPQLHGLGGLLRRVLSSDGGKTMFRAQMVSAVWELEFRPKLAHLLMTSLSGEPGAGDAGVERPVPLFEYIFFVLQRKGGKCKPGRCFIL